MRTVLDAWRRFYGENPLHLLALLGCFALIGYVVSMVYTEPTVWWMLVWFLGSVIAHDLVLYPLYALADGSLLAGRWARRKLLRGRRPRVPAVNHVRVPVLGSALVGLIFLPSIIQQGELAYLLASGLTMDPYLERWLAVVAALFLGSALVYAARLAGARRRGTSGQTDPKAGTRRSFG